MTDVDYKELIEVLKRLEKSGFITSGIEVVEGKPSRRNYTITESGRKAMKEKVTMVLSNCPKLISPFDLGIANIHLLDREEAMACLRKHQ